MKTNIYILLNFPDLAGLGGRLEERVAVRGVRAVHGAVRRRHRGHAAAALVRGPGVGGGRVRRLHRRQLLSHQYHPRGADHAREVHECVWVVAAHAGHGQSHRTTLGW